MSEKLCLEKQYDNQNNVFKMVAAGMSSYHDVIKRNGFHYCAFEYIVKGEGELQINSNKYAISEGNIFILHRDSNHMYFSNKDNPWTKIWFIVDGPLAYDLIYSYQLNNVYFIKQCHDLKNHFAKIYDLFSTIKSTDDMNCKNKDFTLFYHELLMDISKKIMDNTYLDDASSQLKHYLDTTIEKKVSIKELGCYINRSQSQTIRIFKKRYGYTPHQYVLYKKIEAAKFLLINTSLTIKQISYKLSFSDEYYFSNLFKTKTGMSPKKYRDYYLTL